MSPPTSILDSRNLPANGEHLATLNPRAVAREFARILAGRRIYPHPAELRRLADDFITSGRRSQRALEQMAISYADPTGETAARNVDGHRRPVSSVR